MSETWLKTCKSAKVASGESIAYIASGDPAASQAILLIHGYPQTLFSMRHVAAGLSKKGYFIVAADYRGAGGSSVAPSGYDKMTMSADLHSLMTDVLKRKRYIVLGHDIGSMVATAQALQFRDSVDALIMMECPQPGTTLYREYTTDPAKTMELTFHFFFHNAAALPEKLTEGREAIYLQHFFDRLTWNPYFLTATERDIYVDSFKRAGRMTAGFEVYRAFRQDDVDVKENIRKNGKFQKPVLATGGDKSAFTKDIKQMASELADNVSFAAIKDSAHWVPEENPRDLIEEVAKFVAGIVA